MSDILILMRHGKAKRPVEGELDFDRQLTEHGKRSLAATLPASLGLFPKGVATEVWSSPAVRAEETARIMLKACKRHGAKVASDIVFSDALWSQDADGFLDAVRDCKAAIVVAVGHNPFIEEVTAQLTNSRIDIATGGFAAIALDAGARAAFAPQSGRLLWFAQGPISQRWETLVKMEKVLAKETDTMNSRREAFFADPDDIETLHKFRTSIRTLRSLLAFVKPWQNAEQNAAAQEDLKALVAVTSRQRELDVLGEQAQEMEGSSPELVEFCATLAAAERKRVQAVLSSKGAVKRLARVTKELHAVKWRRCVETTGLTAQDVRVRFDGFAADLEKDLAELNLSDAEKTHDVRKDAKRVRYNAERFKKLIGEDAVGIAEEMTARQDSLGAICDARVNIDIINGFTVDELPERVAWDLALLRAQNETFLYSALRDAKLGEVSEAAADAVPDAAPAATSEAAPDAVPAEAPDAAPEAIPEVIPEARSAATPEAPSGTAPEAIPDEAPAVVPEAATGVVTAAAPEAAPESLPDAASEAIPVMVSESAPDPLPAAIPEAVSQATPAAIPAAMSQTMPAATPEVAAETVPKPLSEAAPEAMPNAVSGV